MAEDCPKQDGTTRERKGHHNPNPNSNPNPNPINVYSKETLAAKNSKLKQGGEGGSVSSDERAAMEVTIQP